VFLNRALGPLFWAYWTMVSCNVLIPQLLWFGRVRRSVPVVFVISLLVNVGMWFERFIIIVTSLSRDFIPANWSSYRPTIIEVATFAGTFGLFFTCYLLFCRLLPVIAVAEVKGALQPTHHEPAGPLVWKQVLPTAVDRRPTTAPEEVHS
jgi:Ni/Fe-hydrogenase subunit HybB-like protein